MKRKRFPFRKGQKVRLKDQKDESYGRVLSNGPATIGDPKRCKIPGGPLVLEGCVYVKWRINGKWRTCIEEIENLEPSKENT